MLRELMKHRDVWLETPWPSLYHDMVGERLHLIDRGSFLRTQAKNAEREKANFTATDAPDGAEYLQSMYRPVAVREHGSVLAAMCANADVPPGRFDFPLKPEWLAAARAIRATFNTDKPVLLFRPLMNRTEWGGCLARNPDREAYAAIFEALRARFYVVSIADLVPGKEWIVGKQFEADREYHDGEIPFTTLAALFSLSQLVLTSPGFAIPLAQAVGTPVVCVFGGYENSSSFRHEFSDAPYLGIDPIRPCHCFSHTHDCQKEIDLPAALDQLEKFINAHSHVTPESARAAA